MSASMDARFELLRALGELTAGTGERQRQIASALGLPAWSGSEHTELFVLDLPPYASIHLSAEGKLGGEAADRVAGVWRTLGLVPPSDVDRLDVILSLYSTIGHAAASAGGELAAARFEHLRSAVLWEHISPWVRGYLDAIADAGGQDWAQLARRALAREMEMTPPPPALALALREAPEGIRAEISREELLDALVSPLRSGFVLSRADLARAAPELGVGLRRGERRFALRAMLEQEPRRTLLWLEAHAAAWSSRHRRRGQEAGAGADADASSARQAGIGATANAPQARAASAGTDTDAWWARRAGASAQALALIASRCAAQAPAAA